MFIPDRKVKGFFYYLQIVVRLILRSMQHATALHGACEQEQEVYVILVLVSKINVSELINVFVLSLIVEKTKVQHINLLRTKLFLKFLPKFPYYLNY